MVLQNRWYNELNTSMQRNCSSHLYDLISLNYSVQDAVLYCTCACIQAGVACIVCLLNAISHIYFQLGITYNNLHRCIGASH